MNRHPKDDFDRRDRTGTQSRIIYLTGEFDEDQSKDVIEQLFELECENISKDILFYIDSYGGDIDSFLSIHDAFGLLRCPVATVCIGKAMSCGAMLLMSGTQGKRFITPNARVMTHQLWGAAAGSLSEMETNVKEARRLQDTLDQIFCEKTGMTIKQVKTLTGVEQYLTPKQSVENHIVDWIITKPSDLYSRIKV